MIPPPSVALLLSVFLVAAGLAGLLARRNLVFLLVALELMFSGAALAFVAAAARWGQSDGQVMFLLVVTVAGTEAALALAFLLRIERLAGTLDSEAQRELRG